MTLLTLHCFAAGWPCLAHKVPDHVFTGGRGSSPSIIIAMLIIMIMIIAIVVVVLLPKPI